MSERMFGSMEIWYSADGGGGGGPDPKEVKRDASIHRSSHLINGTPVESTPQQQRRQADTSETGMSDILESLRRLTGFVPPTSGSGTSSGESEDSGS